MPSQLPRTDKQIDIAKRAQSRRLGQSGASGMRKRCRKGKSCGATCINNSKFCLVDLDWVSGSISRVRNEIQGRPRPGAGAAGAGSGGTRPAPGAASPGATRPPAPKPKKKPEASKPKPKPKEKPKKVDNRPISEKLKDALPKFDVRKDAGGNLEVSQKIDGRDLRISFSKNGSIVFTVDGRLTARDDIPERTGVKIALQVRKAAREFFKTIPDDTVFTVSAYTSDGKGEKRVEAYRGIGFSKPPFTGGTQTGTVKGGKLRPSSSEEINNAYGKTLEFKESENEAEDVKNWFIVLFGRAPKSIS